MMLSRAAVTLSWLQAGASAIGFRAPSTRIIGGAPAEMCRSEPLVMSTACSAASRSGSAFSDGSRREVNPAGAADATGWVGFGAGTLAGAWAVGDTGGAAAGTTGTGPGSVCTFASDGRPVAGAETGADDAAGCDGPAAAGGAAAGCTTGAGCWGRGGSCDRAAGGEVGWLDCVEAAGDGAAAGVG